MEQIEIFSRRDTNRRGTSFPCRMASSTYPLWTNRWSQSAHPPWLKNHNWQNWHISCKIQENIHIYSRESDMHYNCRRYIWRKKIMWWCVDHWWKLKTSNKLGREGRSMMRKREGGRDSDYARYNLSWRGREGGEMERERYRGRGRKLSSWTYHDTGFQSDPERNESSKKKIKKMCERGWVRKDDNFKYCLIVLQFVYIISYVYNVDEYYYYFHSCDYYLDLLLLLVLQFLLLFNLQDRSSEPVRRRSWKWRPHSRSDIWNYCREYENEERMKYDWEEERK